MKLRTLEAIYHYRRVGRRALSLFLAVVMLFGLAAPALSMTIAVVTTESAFSSGELFDGDGSYSIRVVYDEEAQLPEDVRLVTSEVVDTEAYLAAAEAELAAGQKAVFSRFFEISLVNAEGNPIQPAAPVGVVIETSDEPEDAQARVFHYLSTDLSTSDDAVFVDEQAEDGDEALAESELTNAELEGLRLESSLLKRNGLMANRAPGLDEEAEDEEPMVTLPLVEPVEIEDSVAGTIAFMADGFSVYGVVWTVDFTYGENGFEFEYSIEGGTAISLRELLPMLGIAENDEQADQFCAGVVSVEFSDPDLIAVAHTETETTVEELAEVLELDIEFSADLSEEEIEAVYNKSFMAGEWVLIGLCPFDSSESLTVTMDNGEVFVISVKDARLTGTVITAGGERYTVEVIYGEDAGIPENAYLTAEEVEVESESVENAFYTSDWYKVEIGNVRSFDIAVHDESGVVIEPLAPVYVQIRLEDGFENAEKTTVVHFTQEGEIELLDAKTRSGSVEGSEEVVVTFEADSFSTFSAVPVTELSDLDGRTFALVLDNPLKDGSERHALQSIEHSQNGRLRAYTVYTPADVETQPLAPANGISGWTFEKVPNPDNDPALEGKYYLKAADGPNEGKYLTISTKTSVNGSGLTMEDQFAGTVANKTQELTVQVKNGKVRICVDSKNGRTNAVDDYDSGSLSSGFAVYRSKSGKAALENFTLYPIVPPPATDTLGLNGKTYVIANQANGTGAYSAVNPNTDTNTVGGTAVNIDSDGYVTTETAPKWTFVFSGEEGKYFIRPSTDPTKYMSIAPDGSITLTETPTALTVEKVEGKDRYIVKNDSGVALTNNGAGGFGGVSYPEGGSPSAELGFYKILGELELDPPSANKVLTPNKYTTEDGKTIEDGTYTLTLSVKGTSKEEEQTNAKKSNVLFIMDRSSSMVTNAVGEAYIRYTGTDYTSRQFYGKQQVSGVWPPIQYVDGKWYKNQEGFTSEYDPKDGIYYRITNGTRLVAEQAAMNDLIEQLMAKNNNDANIKDLVDVNVISFATKAGNQQEYSYPYNPSIHSYPQTGNWSNRRTWGGTESGWQNGIITTALENAVNDNDVARGTNWEEALKYAKAVMDAKKQADGPDEDYYIIFLTDGAPTATSYSITQTRPTDEYTAYYYETNSNVTDNLGRPRNSSEPAYQDSADDARALVDAGYKLYNIYTYGSGDDYKYMVRLTNYAYRESEYIYDNVHDNNEPRDYYPNSDAAKEYFENATDTSKLVAKFEHILSKISASAAYGRVSITDILTQDSLTTALVAGSAGGFRYNVKNSSGTLYTVTASDPATEGGDPSVTFNIPGLGTFPGVKKWLENVPVPGSDPEIKDNYAYYVPDLSSLNNDNLNPEDYKIALADVDENGQVSWNLTGIGTLRDGYTYEVEFVVWPNQEAFDYVSGLNNHAEGFVWNTSLPTYQNLVGTKGYEIGGVDGYPSIVRYPDGTFAVLTNVNQTLNYSTVETVTGEDGIPDTKYEEQPPVELPLPEPMKLIDTDFLLRKQWDAGSNLSQLVKFLYNTAESRENALESYKKTVEFRILQDGKPYKVTKTEPDPNNPEEQRYVYETDPETGEYILDSNGNKIPVKEDVIIYIGWNEEEQDYIWGGSVEKVIVENKWNQPVEYEIGSYWDTDYYISIGVMLSEEKAAERRININDLKTPDNPDGRYIKAVTESGKIYYLLEEGHEYTIDEQQVMLHDYHFDFISDTYHPMLVDGVKKDVTFKRDANGNIKYEIVDGVPVYKIESMTADNLEMPPLTGYNTLRGSMVIQKEVRDYWGNTIAPGGTTDTFKINIEFQNDPGTFVISTYEENGTQQETDHVPWVSVNGGYYCLYYKTASGYEMVYHDDGTPIYVADTQLGTVDYNLYDAEGNLIHDYDSEEEGAPKLPKAYLKVINGFLYRQDESTSQLNNGAELTYSLVYDIYGNPIMPNGTNTMPESVMRGDETIIYITDLAEEPEGSEGSESTNGKLADFIWLGNRMVEEPGGAKAVTTIYITNQDVVEIVNIPAGTQYTVSEDDLSDLYLFVSEKKGLMKVVTDESTGKEHYEFDGNPTETETMTVHDEITPNAKTGILFTNRQKPTYDVTIQKNDQGGQPLAGAYFNLYTEAEYNTGIGKVKPLKKDLVSSSDAEKRGQIYLGDLAAGKYYLVETKAPDGYNLLTGPIEITVLPYDAENIMFVGENPYYVQYSGNGTETPMTNGISVTSEEREIIDGGTQASFKKYFYTLTVKNTSGYELPSTGGHGTAAFTIAGLTLAITSGAILTKRRAIRKKD